jgi:hypothetical protein
VRSGGGLLLVTGPESAPERWSSEWNSLLPGRPSEIIERDPIRGATLAQVDRDHPAFTLFRGARGSGLGTPRFFRYRNLELIEEPLPASVKPESEADEVGPRVIARFDDGSPALAQRMVGAGRVLLWTSTLDTEWSDFPLHPVFLPLVREVVQFTAGRRETVPYFTVGQPMDSRYLLVQAGIIDEGAAEAESDSANENSVLGLLVAPDGSGLDLAGTGGALLQLAEPGFYEVRRAGQTTAEWVVAVNPDVREADPARLDPEELMLAMSQGATEDSYSQLADNSLLGEGTDTRRALEEGERRQGVWRFLLLGAMVLLLGETLLVGRRKPLAKQVS